MGPVIREIRIGSGSPTGREKKIATGIVEDCRERLSLNSKYASGMPL
jgi:hypothetical protein